ncbi:MAG: hypothetical protein IPM54_01945 [Polyangiaceae bacterium]|nr:hypothetical protein [Polyangiaceae bacterium]
MRADRRREIWAATTAIVAHVLFLTLAPRTPHVEEEPPPPIIDVPAGTMIDIDSANESGPSAPNASPLARAPAETAATRAATSELTARTPPAAPVAEPAADPASDDTADEEEPQPVKPEPAPAARAAESEPGPVKPLPAPVPTDEYGAPPPPDPVAGVPGLSGPVWSVPGAMPSAGLPKPAPTTIAAAPIVPSDVASRVLSGTLHSRDKAAGIDVPAAGVVASSIGDAMRGSALTDVKGTFEVKLDGAGNVQSVRFVGSTDGDVGQWAGVADAARRSLAGKTLQMGPDKQGVTVVVKVESKVQYPAGTKEKIDVKPVCANEVVEQLAAAIEGAMQPGGGVRGIRDDQGRFIPYDELDEERRSRFCIPIGIRGKGDLSNIGALMTNVVSTSFQVKRSGEQALPADAPLPIDRSAPWLPTAQGKTRAPSPPKKKPKKKKRPRRTKIVPVQIN